MNHKILVLQITIRDFIREYLSTPADRARTGENLIAGCATLALILATAWVLFAME